MYWNNKLTITMNTTTAATAAMAAAKNILTTTSINDGNYYLVAYADYAQEMRTYRVDRIKDIRFTGEPRDGDEEFSQMDVKSYATRVFSMVRGDLKLVYPEDAMEKFRTYLNKIQAMY